MAVVNHPLRFLIFALILLIGMLCFFKIVEWIFAKAEKRQKKKEAKKAEQKVKKEEPKKEEKIVANKEPEIKAEVKENTVKQDNIAYKPFHTVSNGYNYLHDRFVDNPTQDDVVVKNEYGSMFLSEEEYRKVREEKIEIKVQNDGCIHSKISNMLKDDNSDKEKLIEEFSNLSKEMKLLLIENILKKS